MTRRASPLLLSSILLVLIATLYPFNFSFNSNFGANAFEQFHQTSSNLIDSLRNILLFLPFGMSFTHFLGRKWKPPQAKFRFLVPVLVLIASASLSLTVELLQVLLPDRSATLWDIGMNTLGGVLGFSLVAMIQRDRHRMFFSPPLLGIGAFVYSIVLGIALLGFQNSVNLGNWDNAFPLLLGNEFTGDRPWEGRISHVYFADQALESTAIERIFAGEPLAPLAGRHLVAAYPLEGTNSYGDRSHHSPPLVWQPAPPPPATLPGVTVSAQHWLKTQTAATDLNQRLRQTNQFSLVTQVQPANTTQTGPARIISLSLSPFHRNLTLGQVGEQLSVRLRTPVTGPSGSFPEFIVPNVFRNTAPQTLVLTYQQAALRLYLNHPHQGYTVEITPEIMGLWFWATLRGRSVEFTPASQPWLRGIFYSVVWLPFGILLGLFSLCQRKLRPLDLRLLGVSLLPPIVLEGLKPLMTSQPFNLMIVVLGAATIATSMLTVRAIAHYQTYLNQTKHYGFFH